MHIRVLFLLLAIGFSIYGFSLNNEFVLDDEEQIVGNQVIHDLKNWPLFFSGSTMNQGGSGQLGGIYYKPMMTLAYAVTWSLFEASPTPYRALQIFLHICNAFLFYLLLLNFAPFFWSLLAAFIFLCHPLNTEAVIYLADLQDVMFTFFGLLAFNLFLSQKINLRIQIIGVCLLLLLSLMSKESGALFLVLAFLIPFIFALKNKFRIYAGLLSVVGIYAGLRFGLAGLTNADHGVTLIGRATTSERLLTFPLALTQYFGKLFWPQNLTTTQNWVITHFSLTEFLLPLLFLISLAIGLLILYFKKPNPWLLLFLFWLAGGLFLHSHILVPLDGTVADRWFYFPMLACLGLMVYFLKNISLDMKKFIVLCIGIVLPLSARSFIRSTDWKDGYTLYLHDLEITPDSYDLQNNVGVEYFRRGQMEKALEHFKISTQLAPHWTINWNNLGAAYEQFGRTKEAEEAYLRSLNNGMYYIAYENYPRLLIRAGKIKEARQFLDSQGLRDLPYNQKLREMDEYLKSLNGK